MDAIIADLTTGVMTNGSGETYNHKYLSKTTRSAKELNTSPRFGTRPTMASVRELAGAMDRQ